MRFAFFIVALLFCVQVSFGPSMSQGLPRLSTGLVGYKIPHQSILLKERW
jgi:hypothetical protein